MFVLPMALDSIASQCTAAVSKERSTTPATCVRERSFGRSSLLRSVQRPTRGAVAASVAPGRGA